MLFAMFLQGLQQMLLHRLRLAQLGKRLVLQIVLLGPGQQNRLVWHNDANEGSLQRVTINERLRNQFMIDIDIFNLFRCNIFTLSKLEDAANKRCEC